MALTEKKPDYEQYHQYVGRRVSVTISESTGYFSGRNYECERITPKEQKSLALTLKKVTSEGLEGRLENGEYICVKYSEHQERQLSSELEAGIQRSLILDKRICKVEPM